MWNILSHGAAELVTAEDQLAQYPADGDIVALILFLAVIVAFAVYVLIRNRMRQKPVAEPVAEPVSVPETVIPKAPGSAGQLKLYNVEPKTAAMIMAIVADKMGKPLNELRFLSIKEVE